MTPEQELVAARLRRDMIRHADGIGPSTLTGAAVIELARAQNRRMDGPAHRSPSRLLGGRRSTLWFAFASVILLVSSAFLALRISRAVEDKELPAVDFPATSVLVSASADRSAAARLDGQPVAGTIFVYVTAPNGAGDVRFFLDDPTMSRPAVSVDRSAPFDFAGTAPDGTAVPFDTTNLSAGTHTLTARISLASGDYYHVAAIFTKEPTDDARPVATPGPTPTATARPPVSKKWHPGHYLNAYWGTSKDMPVTMGRLRANPHLKGFLVAHAWTELEPREGVYDFTRIANELAEARTVGKQLMILVVDRTFKNTECVPAYLRADPAYKGGSQRVGNNCTALRWVPAVQDRLIALYAALGKRFDADPNLEAVRTSEDSVEVTAGYDPRAYVEQQKRGMTALARAFPRTVVLAGHNWGPGMDELFAHARRVGVGISGPDLMPNHPTYSYPFYPQYAGKIPLEIGVQDPRVRELVRGGDSITKMFDFAVTDPKGLRVNYLVWDQPESPEVSVGRDILPVINARKGQINTGCPTAFTCR